MAPSTRMIGQVFRDELAKRIATLPLFLRPQLAPVLGLLLDWVEYTEGRLTALEALEAEFPLLDEGGRACTCDSTLVTDTSNHQPHCPRYVAETGCEGCDL